MQMNLTQEETETEAVPVTLVAALEKVAVAITGQDVAYPDLIGVQDMLEELQTTGCI